MGDVELTPDDIEPQFAPPAERLRRALAALAAALIAAAPMCVPSDGPPAPIGPLTLTLGWWLLLTGVAVWRLFAPTPRRLGGPVALSLFALIVCLAVRTAFGTSNSWLSWQTVWQWAALPAAFLAVRELTHDPDDARGLAAVLLATGIAALGVHLAPQLAAASGYTWPADGASPRMLPDGYAVIEPSLDSDESRRYREWCIDGFWMALLAPAAVVMAVSLRKSPVPRHRFLGWSALAVVATAIALRCVFVPAPPPLSWNPALSIATQSPWGVGPGLYSRFAGRHAAPTAEVVIADAPNSYVGLASTGGWLALGLLVIALALLFKSLRMPPPNLARLLDFRPRWELQAGGIAGLLGGLALQVKDWPAVSDPPIVAFAFSAGIRAIVWCVAYSCAETCMMSARADRALPWGMLAVGAMAFFYDVLQPIVGVSFWVAAALAVNLCPVPQPVAVVAALRQKLIVLTVAVAALGAFVWTAYVPTVVSHLAEHRFMRTVPLYTMKADLLRRAEGPIGKSAGHGEAARFVSRSLLQPLIETTQRNPRNPSLPLLRVPWYVALAEHGGDKNPGAQAILTAQAAAELDFENVSPFLAEFHAHLRLSKLPNASRAERWNQARDLIAEIVRRDPALEAQLWAELALAFANTDRPASSEQAEFALRLDAQAPSTRFRLSHSLREKMEKLVGRK